MIQKCSKCHKWKDAKDFFWNFVGHKPVCKRCQGIIPTSERIVTDTAEIEAAIREERMNLRADRENEAIWRKEFRKVDTLRQREIDARHAYCTRCGRYLPIEEFYKDRNTKSGIKFYCKKCCREIAHNRYEFERKNIGKNPEKSA
jgi:hypothetical protein